ncbi:type II toxin-antitoxin system VapC family toxin [Actinosynnema pretiosum]|uniref:PIN domain-containing protein n=1 Tax=Actinosynnema pretiosum TaxID=42197 RepID=A0A290YZC4_9PSEU|nr:PIN domain-containing protein [Actinosynnema pretiosum]ATE52097.1 hypothetical protein CNX65_01335 [Actinosynnema pretiosum]
MTQPSNFDLVYFDSNVFIHYLNREPRWYSKISALMTAADAGQFRIVTSPLLIVEAIGQSPGGKVNEQLEAVALAILDSKYVLPQEFNRSVAIRARDYVLRHRIPKMDAIHLASAVEANVDVLMTTDDDDYPIGTKFDGVWVDNPFVPTVMQRPDDLFAEAHD